MVKKKISFISVLVIFMLSIFVGSALADTQQTVAENSNQAVSNPNETLFTENALSDDFNMCDKDGWDFYGGEWTGAEAELVFQPGDGHKALAQGTNFSDFVYEGVFIVYTKNTSADAGIIFRVSNPSVGHNNYDGYYAGVNIYENKVFLGKSTNGRWTELKSVPLKKNVNYGAFLKVVAKGSNIKVYVDNNYDMEESDLHINIADSTYKSGAIGVLTNKAYGKFYNVMAYELTEEYGEVLSGLENNKIKFYADNSKRWATAQAKNNITFGPSDRIAINDPTLINLAKEITQGINSDYEKAEALHKWVIDNVYYDRDSYTRKKVLYYTPIDVYTHKFTSCNGYANILATLLNIVEIPCILVEGSYDDYKTGSNYRGSHVWNEAYINDRWVIMDPTYDSANYYENAQFNKRSNYKIMYFDPSLEDFTKDHKIRTYFVRTPK